MAGPSTNFRRTIWNFSVICWICACNRWTASTVCHIRQYLLSALRYQLNYTCYTRWRVARYRYTPAFTGYLTEAQANAIEKMRDKRVWGYWAHECLVGYQRWDPDPIKFANVMYTGFFGVMLGVFETLNDARFSAPGAR